jgi:hypothetical protein
VLARELVVRVKSRNERNPYRLVASGSAGHSSETADLKSEEGGDDVKSSWPLCPGLHTCYNGGYSESLSREAKPIPKNPPQYR